MTEDFVLSHDRPVPHRRTLLDVTAPDGSGGDLVPARLLGVWEAAYREYVSASAQMNLKNDHDRQALAQLSVRVAVAWRRLAETPGVAWWLVTAFSTAAEAMEQQAQDWESVSGGRHDWRR
jgi:hypothetical protein